MFWIVFPIFFITSTLHELGHGLMARLAGLDVCYIKVGPFITILGINKEGATERQKSLVALGGPLVDLTLLWLLPLYTSYLGREIAGWLALVLVMQLIMSIIPYKFEVKKSRGGGFLYRSTIFIPLKSYVTRESIRPGSHMASDGYKIFSYILSIVWSLLKGNKQCDAAQELRNS